MRKTSTGKSSGVRQGKIIKSDHLGALPLNGLINGMVWYGMVWYGMVWYGMVWYGMVWYGMVWYGKTLFKHASLDQHKLLFMRGVTQ